MRKFDAVRTCYLMLHRKAVCSPFLLSRFYSNKVRRRLYIISQFVIYGNFILNSLVRLFSRLKVHANRRMLS